MKEYMDIIMLKMPKTEANRNEGINDGNMETYKNSMILSLTKEELQNSTDAASDKDRKVIVEFNDFMLEKEAYPDFETTLRVFEEEKEYWDIYLKEDKKAVEFLDNGIEILKKPEIRCLRISDFNTTGLSGVGEEGSSPWTNLVMNKGVSDKPGNAGGSFGIGKDAAFACSGLRTVFYNTIPQYGKKGFQGVLKLPSYKKNDVRYDGYGYYSYKSNDTNTEPICESCSLDKGYERKDPGMDKYILGLDINRDREELKRDIIVSSINNFLVAFFNNTLEIKYDDITVNKDTLEEIFEKYSESGILELTKEYYETLKNPHEIKKLTIFEEDDVELIVRLDPNASRRAAIVRQTGMKVFDKSHINRTVGFSAIVILKGNDVNAYFKKLENAEHSGWFDDRGKNSSDAKKKQEAIFKPLREIVIALNGNTYEESIDSDGLNEYLPYAYVTGNKEKVESLSNEVEKKEKATKKKKPKHPEYDEEEIIYEKDENGNIIEGSITIGKTPGKNNPNPLPGDEVSLDTDGEEGLSQKDSGEIPMNRKMSESNMDYTLLSTQKGYKLKFKSKENIETGFFEILLSGEKDAISVDIARAELNGVTVNTKSNKIFINNIIKGNQYELQFELVQALKFALEVIAYESKK